MRCPQCGTLIEEPGRFVCPRCAPGWIIREGIPMLNREEGGGDVFRAEELQPVVEIAERRGWEAAFYEYHHPRVARGEPMPEDRRSADWLYHLPLSHNSTALVLGCGWGTQAIALAETCGAVHVLDPIWERLRLLGIWTAQHGVQNLFPFYTHGRLDIPFRAGAYDLVVINGDIAWAHPVVDPGGPPSRPGRLEDDVRQVARWLAPSGALVLVGSNRLGVQRVTRIGAAGADLQDGRFRRTGLLSLWGYRRLAQRVGLTQVALYAPLPAHTGIPLFLLPLDSAGAIEHLLPHLFPLFATVSPEVKQSYQLPYAMARAGVWTLHHLRLAALIKFVVPGFILIARKPVSA